MHANIATTVSIAAAVTSFAVARLASRLSASPSGRHFRFGVLATCAGGVYALGDAIVAGSMSPRMTVWAVRIELFALCIHSVAWMAFFASWAARTFTKAERIVAWSCAAIAPLAFVPGFTIGDTVTEHTVVWLGVTYRDVESGMGGPLIVLVTTLGIALSARSAYRMGQQNVHARHMVLGFVLFVLIAIVDTLTGLRAIDLPYFAPLAIGVVPLFIASSIASEFVENADKLARQANELATTRAALVERERLAAVGQVSAVVAHEVRNPVAIIFNAVATLSRRTTRSEDKELVEIVRHEAERLKRLVEQLLDSVRPFELQTLSGSVDAVVADAVAVATKGASVDPVEVVVEEIAEIVLEADTVLLVQALANLVTNALLAPGRQSPVRLRACLTGATGAATVRVEVLDDGDGVSEENAARLFTPFFTTRATGTGLGLTLVKRIAEAHGGSIEYVNRNPGAAFVLSIPQRRSPAPRPARSE
ncbi:MAG: Flagellar sensor histidine kinase FleS [Labilithrix sp.]|nr:Flagellar sensor histidine kinase FleS [Labilithrix sp.]